MSVPIPTDPYRRTAVAYSRDVRGKQLRWLLVAELMRSARPLTTSDLVGACERHGVTFDDGRASKIVSDALRWEIRKARVRRVKRGVYEFGRAPRSTRWWLNRQAAILVMTLGRLPAHETETGDRLLPTL